ncbi:MAG: hypothetical protein EPO40_04770 [Myxococcaceae bacterium]|nr:MAG: hypothetical protein EPO40_04770 [Myxococcaceae bacterium]
MTRGARIFLVLAVVWLGLWGMGSVLFFKGSRAQSAQAAEWALPATGLVRGGDVRFEGVVDGRNPVTAPLSQRPCAAALTHIYYGTWYYDGQGERQLGALRIATRRAPEAVGIVVGAERVDLPLDLWRPPTAKSADVSESFAELPARLAVPAADVASARASARGTFTHFSADEWRLSGGERVFVVGHVEERDGRLRLAPHRGLGRVDVFRGSQADGVRDLRSGSSGLRIAGGIFAALAVLPLLGFAIAQLRRRRAHG